jgi:hypothetical protein
MAALAAHHPTPNLNIRFSLHVSFVFVAQYYAGLGPPATVPSCAELSVWIDNPDVQLSVMTVLARLANDHGRGVVAPRSRPVKSEEPENGGCAPSCPSPMFCTADE